MGTIRRNVKKINRLVLYVLKNICVPLEVALLYEKWFSCVECWRLCKNAVWCWYKVMVGLFDSKFDFSRLLIEHLYHSEFKSAIIYCLLVMTFFILTRFVLV